MRDLPHQMLSDKSNDSTTTNPKRSQSSNSHHSGCSISPQPIHLQNFHDEMHTESRSSTPDNSENMNDIEKNYDQHMSDSEKEERERESDGITSPPPLNPPCKIQIKTDQELFSRHTPDKPEPVNLHCKNLSF